MNKQRIARSEYSLLPVKENINILADSAWQLTLNSLWPHSESARSAEDHCKQIIKRKIMGGQNPYEKYLEYCQQILLCWKILLEEYAFGQTDRPAVWFHPENPNGFVVSKILYKNLEKERKKDPMKDYEIKALPEALLEMREQPCRANFNYWKNWFAERYAYDEYILFYLCCIMNSHNFKQ